jgi:hypothetical protein
MPPLGRTHHDRRSSRDKTSPRKAVWSDRSFVDHLDDEQLGQYNRRATASGVMEHQYDTRQTIDSAPSFGSGQYENYSSRDRESIANISKGQGPTPREESTRWDGYPPQTTTADQTYLSANTVSYGALIRKGNTAAKPVVDLPMMRIPLAIIQRIQPSLLRIR